MAGIWGTLSLGLFAAGRYRSPTPTGEDVSTVVTGLFYGGGFGVLKTQIIGSFSVTVATFVASTVLMYGVKFAFRLRVPTDGEIEGLDLHEHGFPAYPEYVVTGEDGCPKTIDDVPVGRRTVGLNLNLRFFSSRSQRYYRSCGSDGLSFALPECRRRGREA
jgi:hypothetical protein